VLAVNSAGYSAESNEVSATTPTPPSAPGNLVLTVLSSSSIQLGWSDNSSNETGFRIERQTGGGGSWSVVTTTAAGVTAFTDNSVQTSTQYAYRVSAVNVAGASGVSNVATGTTQIVLPAAPSALVLTVQSSNAIGLTWTDNSDNESGFQIERQTGGTGPWTVVTTTAADIVSYSDATVLPETQYAYRVSAVNSAGTTAVTNVVSGTTPSAVILTPGSGWTGPTAQPDTQGQAGQTGYTATAIARWDVVPYQTFSGDFNVGVVAFDIAGIDHVAFSVNGGPWSNVSEMTLNPQTGVVEYWATMRAGDFAQDGAVEVRAIAVPKVGVPRVLDALTLYSNGGGTLNAPIVWLSPTGNDQTGQGTQANPWASLVAACYFAPAGATVYLEPGTYDVSSRDFGYRDDGGKWLRYTPAPGVTRDQVTIVYPSNDPSMRAGKLELDDVRLDMTSGVSLDNSTGGVWLNNVELFGSLNAPNQVSLLTTDFIGAFYVTNTDIQNIAGYVMNGVTLARNVTMEHMTIGHPFNNPGIIINVTMDDISSGSDPTHHVDGISWGVPGGDANSIVYGMTITNLDSGLVFLSYWGFQNLAIVNVTASTIGTGPGGISQFGYGPYGNYNHVYLDNVRLNDQSFAFTDDGSGNYTWNNVLVKNSQALQIYAPLPIQLIGDSTIDGSIIPDR
jgi:hypothetical protein